MEKSNLSKLVTNFRECKIGFVFIKEYTDKEGFKSDVLINLGYSYGNAKERDIKFLKSGDVKLSEKYSEETNKLALSEKLQSLIKPDENRSNGQINAYENLTSNGTVKLCLNTGNVLINAIVVKKNVLPYELQNSLIQRKVVKSAEKTLAKKFIEKQLRTGHIRHYIFTDETIKSLTVNGNLIELGYQR